MCCVCSCGLGCLVWWVRCWRFALLLCAVLCCLVRACSCGVYCAALLLCAPPPTLCAWALRCLVLLWCVLCGSVPLCASIGSAVPHCVVCCAAPLPPDPQFWGAGRAPSRDWVSRSIVGLQHKTSHTERTANCTRSVNAAHGVHYTAHCNMHKHARSYFRFQGAEFMGMGMNMSCGPNWTGTSRTRTSRSAAAAAAAADPAMWNRLEGTFAWRIRHPNQCSGPNLSQCFTPVIPSLGCPFQNCESTSHSYMIGRSGGEECSDNINVSLESFLALLGTKRSAQSHCARLGQKMPYRHMLQTVEGGAVTVETLPGARGVLTLPPLYQQVLGSEQNIPFKRTTPT